MVEIDVCRERDAESQVHSRTEPTLIRWFMITQNISGEKWNGNGNSVPLPRSLASHLIYIIQF